MRGCLGWMLGLLVLAATAGPASAQETGTGSGALDQEARALYEAGRVAFDDGRFDDALGYFERAHDLSGRPQLLFNIGSAADRLRQNARALEAFEAYLEEVPDAPNRRSVESRIRVLQEALAAEAEDAATGDGDEGRVPSPEETAAAGLEGDGSAAHPGTETGSEPPSRKGLWIGIGVGAGVLVGLAVVLGVVLSNRGPDYQPSEQGHLVFTLEQTP